MATIKAGTYRFNDEITLFSNDAEYSLEFTSVFIRYQGADEPKTVKFDEIRFADSGNALMYSGKNDNNKVVWYYVYEKVSTTGLASGWVGIHHTITLIKEQTVSDAFYEWFTANAVKVVATINHEGCIISGIKGGQTATLKCAGMKMETDVVVAVSDVGGGESTCNCVIEVDTLPTENIDENAVYLCGGAYYKYAMEFVTVVQYGMDISDLADAYGMSVLFEIVPTKPTVFPEADMAFYYVEDEDDFYVYEPSVGLTDMATQMGADVIVVSNIAETTSEGLYAVMQNGLKKYSAPTGTLTITENGTHDVSGYASARVNIPSSCVVQTVADLPEDAPIGSVAIVIGGK